MARSLHIVLVCVLMLQCSPLCACALNEVISGTTETFGGGGAQRIPAARTTGATDCPAERNSPRDCPCFCASSTKVAVPPATKGTVAVSDLSLQSVMFGDLTHAAADLRPGNAAQR